MLKQTLLSLVQNRLPSNPTFLNMSPIILRISLILAGILTIVSANPIVYEAESSSRENRYPSVSNVEIKGSSQTITSKTSSLLAEALQMIRNAKDAKERKWLESFVHRLARLASDLEQEKEAEKVLKTIKTQEKTNMPSKENEVLVSGKTGARSPKSAYSKIEDDPRVSTAVSVENPENKDTTYSAVTSAEKVDMFDIDLQQVPEKSVVTPQGSVIPLQKQVPLRVVPSMGATGETGPTTPSLLRVPLQRNEVPSSLRQDLVKQIIAKMQKLRDMGATNEEMMDILKRSEFTTGLPKTTSEFEEEEEGAAAGELEPDDLTDISTLAPSLGQIRNNDLSASQPSVAPRSDEDDLVKQLEEEKFILVNTGSTDSDEEDLRRAEQSISEEANYH